MVEDSLAVIAPAKAAIGPERFNGDGRWRVYGTRLWSAGKTIQVVLDRVLAEGFEAAAQGG